MNAHGLDFRIRRHLHRDHVGPAIGQRLFQRGTEMIRRGDARRANAEGFRELDEIRIDQVGRHHAAVKTFALVAADIAIGVVVEHQRHHADLELHGGRQFLHART